MNPRSYSIHGLFGTGNNSLFLLFYLFPKDLISQVVYKNSWRKTFSDFPSVKEVSWLFINKS